MVSSNLESFLRNVRWLATAMTASVAVACNSCDPDILTEASCKPGAVEICNNYNDDNCNGQLNEGCDVDKDGYCSALKPVIFTTGKAPEICLQTFQDCHDSPCESLSLDCDDLDYSVNPGATERCDGKDNDCDRVIDQKFPEKDKQCGEKLGSNFEKDGVGPCQAGTFRCDQGTLTCAGYVGPAERELCNNFSDTCGAEQETPLTEAAVCYEQWIEDQYGNIIKIELPVNDPTANVGTCRLGIKLCINGIIGGDNECHGAKLPELETCDCFDNDCDQQIDEGVHTSKKLQYAVAVDTSGSMNDDIQNVIARFSSVQVPPCFSDETIRISTIKMGEPQTLVYEPILKRSQATVREFRMHFSQDIPGAFGPDSEPSANTIVYTACAVLEEKMVGENIFASLPEICQRIYEANSLRAEHPRNLLHQSVFDPAAEKTLWIVSDEQYQWVGGTTSITPLIDQQQAAQLAKQADIKVIVVTEMAYDNEHLNGFDHGYAYFRQTGGDILDITTTNVGRSLEELIKTDYCQN